MSQLKVDTITDAAGTGPVVFTYGFQGYIAPTVTVGVGTAVSGGSYLFDSSGGAFNFTLPATPSVGDTISYFDGDDFSANNVTLLRNGLNIEGAASDLVLDVAGDSGTLIYVSVAIGWRVY